MPPARLLPLVALLTSLAIAPARVDAATLGLLRAVVEDGRPLQRKAPDGTPAPVMERVMEGELHDRLQQEARTGFTATMLALDEAARVAAGQRRDAPTWLYLSTEDGGFARTGFWLRDGGGLRWQPDPFVDLVVDGASVDDGSFEEIFAHELGHVMLRRLVPGLGAGRSHTAHAALALTDRNTAFDEGFAIHFQAVARRHTRNTRLRRIDQGLEERPFLGYWASNVDRSARIDGVRRNLFVRAQLPLPGTEAAATRFEHSSLFDPARLKSGDQMMASEGVVATVFHRWLGVPEEDAAALPARYAELFASLRALPPAALATDAPVLVELLKLHVASRPEQARPVLEMFVATTYGATADPTLARMTEALAAPGRVGDIEGFVERLGPARARLAVLVDAVVRDPARLDDALSPPLWIASTPEAAAARADLNTAGVELLEAVGLDAAVAAAVVRARLDGGFASADAAIARAALEPAAASRLRILRANAAQAGTHARR